MRAPSLLFLVAVSVAVVVSGVPTTSTSSITTSPPGLTPPMGWRSWNAFELDIDQKLMLAQVDAVAAPGPNGGKSLLELGFGRIGIDDGWQDCGAGVNHSFHNAKGEPLINSTRFPDMLAMTRYAHSKNVKMGWYLNNCWCCEKGHEQANYDQDVAVLVAMEFDGVKIDGCGPAHNIKTWTDAIAKTHVPMLVENCADNHDTWSPPLPAEVEECTYNLYRISSDIAPQFYSTMDNLQHMTPFLDLSKPMSRPSCWAYPDMLQVGNRMNDIESRSHYGAWIITSAPLILGFDLTNKAIYDRVYPLISNEEAININQVWAGHPGHLVMSSNSTFTAPVAHGAGCDCCDDVSRCDKVTFPDWQVWLKPLGGGKTAVFIINISEHNVDVSIDLSTLGLPSRVNARCVWGQMDLPAFNEQVTVTNLASHDSRLFLLTE